jgi:glucosamine 6-phosphate synthetase-like amidotransferase/phosphosugar isomerase protein
MCGILGVYVNNPKDVSKTLYSILMNQIGRGKEGFGVVKFRNGSAYRIRTKSKVLFSVKYIDFWNDIQKGDILLVHHRMPTSTSNNVEQNHPIANESKSIYLIHNGMVTDWRKLYHSLKKEGHSFETEIKEPVRYYQYSSYGFNTKTQKELIITDTEVLVHILESEGIKAIPKTDGMITIAYIDKAEHDRINLFRKRMPVYVYQDENSNVFFSSEFNDKEKRFINEIELSDYEHGYIDSRGYHKVKVYPKPKEKKEKKKGKKKGKKKEGNMEKADREISEFVDTRTEFGDSAIEQSIRLYERAKEFIDYYDSVGKKRVLEDLKCSNKQLKRRLKYYRKIVKDFGEVKNDTEQCQKDKDNALMVKSMIGEYNGYEWYNNFDRGQN